MRHWILFGIVSAIAVGEPKTATSDLPAIKKQILELARSYSGQGDPDRSKQRALEDLTARLLRVSPQPPVKSRIKLLHGTWKQVWGPYDYSGNKRGVDPTLGIDELYQIVFQDGYYYNVAPTYKKGTRTLDRIGLLRGEFHFDEKNNDSLRVRLTNFYGVNRRPTDKRLPELAALAEARQLPGQKTLIPGFLGRMLFGASTVREVYTDEDLRISYGMDGKNGSNDYIYIMTRVP